MKKEVKQENSMNRNEFMKQVGVGFGAIILMNCLQSCEGSEIPDPNLSQQTLGLDFTLDLNVTANNSLNIKGGFLVVGSKKVIVARTLADSFIAVSSACTHQGTVINYRATKNDFKCPNHGSEFNATGLVQTGPATSSLRKFKTSFDVTANTLRIFE